MRYEPVKVSHYVTVEFRKVGVREVPTGRQRHYFQAGGRSIDSCGHKHRTEAAAEPCRRRLQKAWHEHRSRQAKASWLTRKGKAVTV